MISLSHEHCLLVLLDWWISSSNRVFAVSSWCSFSHLLPNQFHAGDEQWLRAPEHPDSLEEELDILSVLRESHLKEPYTLKTIASSVVRTRLCSLSNASILERADQLPLPKSLISSLKLEDFDLRDYVKMSELDWSSFDTSAILTHQSLSINHAIYLFDYPISLTLTVTCRCRCRPAISLPPKRGIEGETRQIVC